MTASLIVVAVGAVAAAVGTAGLAARLSRAPSLFLGAWTVALVALTIALGAEALGYLAGFSDLIFRAAELGSQAIAPLAMCLGLAELIGRSIVTRFTMRLAVSGLGVIALAIMGSDPLNPGVTLSKAWPDPGVTYQIVPAGLIKLLAAFTIFTAVCAGLAVLARSRRGPDFAEAVRPGLTGSCAAVVVALPGVAMLAGSSLSGGGFALSQLVAAVLTWLAATTAARRGLAGAGSARGQRRPGRDAGWPEPDARAGERYEDYDTGGDFAAAGHPDDARYDRAGQPGPRLDREPDSEIRYPALAALAAERLEPPGGREDLHDSREVRRPGPGGYAPDGYDSGPFEPGPSGPSGYEAALEPYRQYPAPEDDDMGGGGDLQPNLFGQITIYTLLEDRIDDFDRLTEVVVEQVRGDEPGTLVYIVHAVPTAPMQRILYEVYQDRAAYDEHLAQPYMARYATERRSMVLATNAIELGLQQAKVSPLASYDAISDMLSESGIDLTGVTRSARRRERPERGGGRYPGSGRDQDAYRYGDWDVMRDEDRYR